MPEIAAYVTFALVSIALILSIAIAAVLSIAIYEASEWMGRVYAHVLAHGQRQPEHRSRRMTVNQ